MPPRPKCTREEIAIAAYEIVKSDGLAALTARELGNRLGTSSRPIFTVFQNMEEVKMAARKVAFEEFKIYVSNFKEYTPSFKKIGMSMVSYGMYEPELFKLMYMQEHENKLTFAEMLYELGDLTEVCINLIVEEYKTTEEEAHVILEQVWTQAYGLGVLCAVGVCDLSEEEIGRRLGITFLSVLAFIKSGKMTEVFGDVEHNSRGIYHGRKLSEIDQLIK